MNYLCHPLRGLLVRTPGRILVHLLPGDRIQQCPELGGQGILHFIIILVPFQRRQRRRGESVGQMYLANRRHKGNNFNPVSLFEVVLGDRTRGHSTWKQ